MALYHVLPRAPCPPRRLQSEQGGAAQHCRKPSPMPSSQKGARICIEANGVHSFDRNTGNGCQGKSGGTGNLDTRYTASCYTAQKKNAPNRWSGHQVVTIVCQASAQGEFQTSGESWRKSGSRSALQHQKQQSYDPGGCGGGCSSFLLMKTWEPAD